MQIISPELHSVHDRAKNNLNAKPNTSITKTVLLPLPVSRSTKSLREERDENMSQEHF